MKFSVVAASSFVRIT